MPRQLREWAYNKYLGSINANENGKNTETESNDTTAGGKEATTTPAEQALTVGAKRKRLKLNKNVAIQEQAKNARTLMCDYSKNSDEDNDQSLPQTTVKHRISDKQEI